MDKLKLRQTIQAAEKYTDLLEQAIDQGAYRQIGAALYNLRRELKTLAEIAEVPPFLPGESNHEQKTSSRP